MSIQIVGFSSSFKVPMFAGETKFGVGGISQGSIPLKLLVVGLTSGSGAIVENGSPVQIFSDADAEYYAGAGSEAARMCYAALLEPGVQLWLACPAHAGGAVAASATITITGPSTSTGELHYFVVGEDLGVVISSGTSAADIATAIAAAINANTKWPVTAAAAGAVVTLTVKSTGVRGNQYILYQDVTNVPTGVTSTLGGGGAAVTGAGSVSGLRFASGAGTEDVTTLLTALFPAWFHRVAFAQNDSTNLGRWKTHINLLAGPLEGRLEHVVFATNGTQSAATSLSTATVNDERFQQLWALEQENHPSEVAARMAALRTATEQDDPDAAYDGVQLTGMAPQRFIAQRAQISTQQSCLDNGVTPLATTDDGNLLVVRSITTHCLRGTTPFYGTLDTSDAYVPDYCRIGIGLRWELFKQQNKRVADDLPGGKARPPGVATPSLWNREVAKFMADQEAATFVIDTAKNPPFSEYNEAAKRIMSVVKVKPAPNQHQLGQSVQQI